MKTLAYTALALGLLFNTGSLKAQDRWTFEFHTSLPYNVPLPLTIRQSGMPDITLTARYSSEPFVIPINWLWRVGYWSGSTGWEVQAVHHKLYLDNRPPGVANFSITHGLNLLTVVRAWDFDGYILRAGIGVGLAHPESEVRGKRQAEDGGMFGLGYYLSGPVIHAGVGRQFPIVGRLYLALDAMVHGAYALVPVVDGDASVYNVSVMLNVGLGFIVVQ